MTADTEVKKAKLSDLTPDANNANLGTQRGLGLLDESLRDLGAGRSILVDKNGRIIAGNKTVERAADLGLNDVLIVPTDGTKIVAVQRLDLDLETDPKAKRLALADNRIAQVDLEWSSEQLLAYAEEDPTITEGLWSEEEWESEIVAALAEEDEEPEGGEKRQTILDQAVQLQPAREYAVIFCSTEEEWERLKVLLELKPVRRGGYREGSPFDATGTERVVHAADFLERFGEDVDSSSE